MSESPGPRVQSADGVHEAYVTRMSLMAPAMLLWNVHRAGKGTIVMGQTRCLLHTAIIRGDTHTVDR